MDDIAADPSHPRYASLLMRHRLEVAAEKGMLAASAMIAHGRGEAFDYLLGERTTDSALRASRQALAALQAADRPVLSINGNVAALACDEMLRLASVLSCPVEVNIFYRTPERMEAILGHINEPGEPSSLIADVAPFRYYDAAVHSVFPRGGPLSGGIIRVEVIRRLAWERGTPSCQRARRAPPARRSPRIPRSACAAGRARRRRP